MQATQQAARQRRSMANRPLLGWPLLGWPLLGWPLQSQLWLVIWAIAARALCAQDVVPVDVDAAVVSYHPRGPIAVHVVPPDSTGSPNQVVVADRSGELLTVDLERRTVAGRQKVAAKLVDLLPWDSSLWVTAAADDITLWRQVSTAEWQKLSRIDIKYTARLQAQPASPSGSRMLAASHTWSRRVTFYRVAGERLDPSGQFDLPFAPHALCWIAGGQRLVATDAFGGNFAIIHPASDEVKSFVGRLPLHNVRGLMADDDNQQLLLAHQTMNPVATTERESVFWGGVIRSLYSRVSYRDLSQTDGASLQTVYPLSTPGDAAADPGPLVRLPDGGIAMTLEGVGQVGIRLSPDGVLLRKNVGSRPQAICYHKGRREIVVASTLSDRISTISLDAPDKVRHIRLHERRQESAAERGERLFYDGRLSLDGWYSCHSCHTDGHANGLTNDNLGDGNFGHPKRIPSLLGVASSGPWAWNGSQESLPEQIQSSVHNTMQGDGIDRQSAADLAAYLQTLQPPPGIDTARGQVATPLRETGQQLFKQRECVQCHAPPSYTSADVFAVKPAEDTSYNPPSLRAVSQRTRLLHDGRAASLQEVLGRFGHGQDVPLTPHEREALIAFLRSL